MPFFRRFWFIALCSTVLAAQVPTPKEYEAQRKAEAKSQTPQASPDDENDNDTPIHENLKQKAVLWRQPGDIASLNLFYGHGGKAGQPTGPFTFLSEHNSGTNPKFDVRDANGKKWRVKLGEEARPEVVASRLLWAVGYFVNDDYILEKTDIPNIDIKRGKNLVKDGKIADARFARKPAGQKKIGTWTWRENRFNDTREFNGLRVMMAVMNNWDLKDENNAVYRDSKTGELIYLASDIGATFGTNGLSWTKARSKGNVDSFKGSKFLQRVTETEVDFATPKRPIAVLIETGGIAAKAYNRRKQLDWIGNNIPRADARWMGNLLGQLSHQQLVDAFRAGDFPEDAIADYVEVVESRIRELKTL